MTTTATTTATTSRCPNPGTKLGALFAALVRRATVPVAAGDAEGVPLAALASEINKSSEYASALLCTLMRRELVARVSTGRYLPTDAGVAAAQAVYGPDLAGLMPEASA